MTKEENQKQAVENRVRRFLNQKHPLFINKKVTEKVVIEMMVELLQWDDKCRCLKPQSTHTGFDGNYRCDGCGNKITPKV